MLHRASLAPASTQEPRFAARLFSFQSSDVPTSEEGQLQTPQLNFMWVFCIREKSHALDSTFSFSVSLEHRRDNLREFRNVEEKNAHSEITNAKLADTSFDFDEHASEGIAKRQLIA